MPTPKQGLVVVTGGTSGIGLAVVRSLAAQGTRVVIGARSLERAEPLRAEIAQQTNNPQVSVMALDVAEPDSVRSFAQRLLAQEPRISALVNNAGVWLAERRVNKAGRELTLATNALGPHLLSELLEPGLRAGAPARIVNLVSSFASDYDPADLDFQTRPYDGLKAYAQSKLVLRVLSWDMAQRLRGSGVGVFAVAPGFVRTPIYEQPTKGFMATMMKWSARWFAISPEKAAELVVWAVTAPELDGLSGQYIASKKAQEPAKGELDKIAEVRARL